MSGHFDFGGSAMDRNIECPGSVGHLKEFPLADTVYSKEGTEKHDACERILKGADPFDVDLDDETMDFALNYKGFLDDLAQEITERTGEQPTLVIEQKLKINIIGENVGGTADAIMSAEGLYGWELHIIDAKNGFEYVDPIKNRQCGTYAIAACHELGIDFDEVTVYFHIYQPNGLSDQHFRSWEVDMKWLKLLGDMIQEAIVNSRYKEAKRSRGDHCQYCNKTMCYVWQDELKSSGLTIAKIESRLPELNKETTERLLKIGELAPMVSKMAKEAAAILFERAQAGDVIPGKKLVKNVGSREWIDNSKLSAMCHDLGMDTGALWKPQAMVGPAPIETLIKKMTSGKEGKEKRLELLEIFNKQVMKPEKGVALVKATDRRESLTVGFTDEDDEELI